MKSIPEPISLQQNGEIITYSGGNIISVKCKSTGVVWHVRDTYKIEKAINQLNYLTIDHFDIAVDGKTILAIATVGGGVSIDKIIKYNPQDNITKIEDFKWDDDNVKEFFDRFKNIERFTTDQLVDLYKQSKLKNK